MLELNVGIGISGAGKSTFFSSFDNYKIICPDEIRKKFCKNVNDQSRNAEVFAIAFHELENGLRNRLNIVFDATNLSCASLNKILHIFNNVKGEKVLHLYLFEISRKPEICKERCRIDIESKVDRADTASVDGLHEKMSEKYIKLIDSDEFRKLIKKERGLPNTEINIFKIDEFGIPELVG